MPKLADHVIICNWSDNACEIVRALHADAIGEEAERCKKEVKRREETGESDDHNPWHPVVVITERNVKFPDEDCFEDTLLIPGSPLSPGVLKRANVEDARAVIIVPDPDDNKRPDDKTLLVALQIRSILP
ncbi:MAG: hypothetical protein FJ088_12905, partial [Deltaproteobacteria bacterium]|nr:hypothetical protein [Deltaproteobacteria bacterium]